MSAARLKHFGWGREGEGLTAEEEAFVMGRAEARFGTTLKQSASARRLEDIKLEAPRVTAPAPLPCCTRPYRTPTANHILNSPVVLRATIRARPTSSPNLETGLTEKAMKQIKNGTLYLIPASPETAGHLTIGNARFYQDQLEKFLATVPRRTI